MASEAILNKENLDLSDIIEILNFSTPEDLELLLNKVKVIKESTVGNKVYYRGLIEISNQCKKDCFYCGIRKSNCEVNRYKMTHEEILQAAEFSYKQNYGSVVLQSGESESSNFIDEIEYLLKEIKKLSNGELGITLSCGEQSKETYERWFLAGAHRYLLRIESSQEDLYYKIHPQDRHHSFERRLNCLKDLKDVGYQVGSGIMLGLPFQTMEDIAKDLLFLKEIDIDMVGMGPYIEHQETPLIKYKSTLRPQIERFQLTLNAISLLRILMPHINMAAATSMQAIDPKGREKAILAGANVIMPNVTPTKYRGDYTLYENKPCVSDTPEQCKHCLENRIKKSTGHTIGYGEWGDSKHFKNRTKK